MVLSREKRLNAGKAPQRLNQAILSTLLLSAQLKTLKKTVKRPYQTSVVSQTSQGLKASKKAPPAPLTSAN
jgi:alanine-alpha-ketoisovalerate/valine-pyruvate aminotransferase